MGTSQSSTGPGAGVALVPPWADDVPQDNPLDPSADNTPDEPDQNRPQEAPPARFRDTRRSLGSYARNGDSRDLRRALGHYVRSGYGGTATMTRRLGGTAATAGRLGSMFQSGRTPDGTSLRDAALANGATQMLYSTQLLTPPVLRTERRTKKHHASRSAMRYPTYWHDSLMLTSLR